MILGPEMRSTGEVMGIDDNFALAFAKSQMAAGVELPLEGNVFLSVRDEDKSRVVELARALVEMEFKLLCSPGTGKYLKELGIENTILKKIIEGRPNITDYIQNEDVALVINTPTRRGLATDEGKIRASTVMHRIPTITTTTAAAAAVSAISAMKKIDWQVKALQDYNK